MRKRKISKYPFRRSTSKDKLERPIKPDEEDSYGFVEEDIWYPSSLFVEDTHLIMLQKYGGFPGYERGIAVYDLILGDVRKAEGIYRKAAILLYDICVRRIYKDGNHRTAIVTATTFLKKNRGKLGTEDPEKIYKFVKSIAFYSVDDVEKWIRNGTIKEAPAEDSR